MTRRALTTEPTCPICHRAMRLQDRGYSRDFDAIVDRYACDGPAPWGGSCHSQKQVPVLMEDAPSTFIPTPFHAH